MHSLMKKDTQTALRILWLAHFSKVKEAKSMKGDDFYLLKIGVLISMNNLTGSIQKTHSKPCVKSASENIYCDRKLRPNKLQMPH